MRISTPHGHTLLRSFIFLLGIAGITGSTDAQTFLPISFDRGPGIHIYAADGLTHKGSDHYEALCSIVNTEFDVKPDSISIRVVFIDTETRDMMRANNPTRFQGKEWCGAYIEPSLILLLGNEESDDTFMHEYMHLLQTHGLLFKNANPSSVHHIIEQNEGLLMGSVSYLSYLKSHQNATR